MNRYFIPLAILIWGLFFCTMAFARDLGQWDRSTQESQWYATLMQPDNPSVSCCGESDAYWCDILKTEAVDGNVKNYCVVTDDRADEPLKRPHIDVGTEIEIPDKKLKWDAGNPTGHAIVFVSKALWVYCYVQNGGV